MVIATMHEVPRCFEWVTPCFDSYLTTYKNLSYLDKDFGIKFITLKRTGNLNFSKKPNLKQFTEISLKELPKYILAPIQSKWFIEIDLSGRINQSLKNRQDYAIS